MPTETLKLILRTPSRLLFIFSYGVVGAALIYLVSIVLGTATGFALPTTALIRWSSAVRWLATYDYSIAYAILLLAMLGVLSTWLAGHLDVDTGNRDEARLARLLDRWGLLLVCTLFVFSVSGGWAGLVRDGDFTAASIVGLVPFSDASGYFASAQDFVRDGTFSGFAMRRPFAAAARETLMMLGGFSYANMVLIQSLLLAAATWFGARSIGRWQGLWAGLAYFCLSFFVLRCFLPTALTEPLGIFWALLSIPFVVETLRTRSLAHALIAFTMTSIGLTIRMGAMFLIPAMMVWLVWRFGKQLRQKIGILLISVAILIAIGATNASIERLYGSGHTETGSNFAYTICGLSIGGNWSDCAQKYASEIKSLPNSEKAVADFLYRQALTNLISSPSVAALRLIRNTFFFVATAPATLTSGYILLHSPPWIIPYFIFLFIALAAFYNAFILREYGDITFWLLAMLSIIASAAIIQGDDGRRVMAVAYPLMCCLAAAAFMVSRPANAAEGGAPLRDRHLLAVGVASVVVGLSLYVGLPAAARAWWLTPPSADVASLPDVHVVFGGRRMTGLLVVPDKAPLPSDVASIHLSDFSEIISRSQLETYQGLVHPKAPDAPFGFIGAPRTEKGASSGLQYIVPAKVLLDKDVPAWRFTVENWEVKKSGAIYWYLVRSAEPVTLR